MSKFKFRLFKHRKELQTIFKLRDQSSLTKSTVQKRSMQFIIRVLLYFLEYHVPSY